MNNPIILFFINTHHWYRFVNSFLIDFSGVSGSRSTEHGCMDPKSGIFEVPFTGVYFFALHVCTHDLKKALLSIRKNGGTELASLYDQNHADNHKVRKQIFLKSYNSIN